MVFEPSLAARAANAETALRSILRGEYDDWVASALDEGLDACRQLLAGVQEPELVNYLSDPDKTEGIRFFVSQFGERSRDVLQDLVQKLEGVVESHDSAGGDGEDLTKYLDVFRALSLRLCEQDQLIERTVA